MSDSPKFSAWIPSTRSIGLIVAGVLVGGFVFDLIWSDDYKKKG